MKSLSGCQENIQNYDTRIVCTEMHSWKYEINHKTSSEKK